jgi:hypothetical protein
LRVAGACAAAAAISSSCLGLATAVMACNGSLAATMLIAARGALSERRPIIS